MSARTYWYRNGDAVEAPVQFDSLNAAAAAEPENGAYLVANTFAGGRVLGLDRHFDRLERSAAALHVPVNVPRAALCALVCNARGELGVQEVRFRVTAVLDRRPWFIVTVESYAGIDPQLKTHGVHCVTVPNSARPDPTVKSTRWMHQRRHLAVGADEPYEFLLCDADDTILEGSSSNFYAVRCSAGDGGAELWTPLQGVLAGITREAVLTVSPIPHRDSGVPRSELSSVRECFITSATRGVVPIRRIDDVSFGAPGPTTVRISGAFERWALEHSQLLCDRV